MVGKVRPLTDEAAGGVDELPLLWVWPAKGRYGKLRECSKSGVSNQTEESFTLQGVTILLPKRICETGRGHRFETQAN